MERDLWVQLTPWQQGLIWRDMLKASETILSRLTHCRIFYGTFPGQVTWVWGSGQGPVVSSQNAHSFHIFSRLFPQHVYETGISPLLDLPFCLARISHARAKPQIKRKHKNMSVCAELLLTLSKDGKSWRTRVFHRKCHRCNFYRYIQPI